MLQTRTQTNGIYRAEEATIRESVRRAEISGDGSALAIAQDALAHLYGRRGEARRGARVAEVAAELLPAELIAERVMLQNTRILHELYAGRFSVVVNLSPRALRDAEQLGNDYYRAQAHSNYANALKMLGEHDPAIEQFTSARIYFERAEHHRHAAATDNNLANLYVMLGDDTQAHEYLDRAESVYRSLGESRPSELGRLLETRARAFVLGKDFDSAKRAIKESLSLIPTDERAHRAESLHTKGMILDECGESDEAQGCYLEAIELLSAG